MSENRKEDLLFSLINILSDVSDFNTDQSFRHKRNKRAFFDSAIQHHVSGLLLELYPFLDRSSVDVTCLQEIKKTMKKLNRVKRLQAKPSPMNIDVRLPNFRTEEVFTHKIHFDNVDPKSIRLDDTREIDEFLGVEFDQEKWTLSGCVQEAGDQKFSLSGVQLLPNGGLQKVCVVLKATFIPDPRSLWKNIPSDKNERFYKPDERVDVSESDFSTTLAASVRGRSHAHKGTLRDDDFGLYSHESFEWSISCVADGAGSCKLSRHGSYLASKRAVNVLKEALQGHYGSAIEQAYYDYIKPDSDSPALGECYQNTFVKAVFEANKALEEAVDKEKGDALADFSTTLILSAVKKLSDGFLVVSFWIGDGAVVIYDKGYNVKLQGSADSGQYAGQTRFLDNRVFEGGEIYKRISIEKVDSLTALILATDGITDAWFDTEKELQSTKAWDRLWSEIEPFVTDEDKNSGLKNLSDWMGFWSPGNHDDRTIAITVPKE